MMIDIVKAAVLGAVEGFTEFLPISSTGHLIILNRWVSFSGGFTKIFDVVIQLGAILAIVVLFWRRLWPFAKGADRPAVFSLWKKALVGCLPAIVVGGLLGSLVEDKLMSSAVVAAALAVGGAVILIVERRRIAPRFGSVAEISYRTALAIGACQCLAMIPGTSRSAATIVGALLLGASRPAAAEFSFFLAVPTMAAASAYTLLKHHAGIGAAEAVLLAVGFAVAFLAALAAVRSFLGYVRAKSFAPFAWYRIALAAAVVAALAFLR